MDNTIIVLKGPDRVRKRPCVIFGSDGKQGAENVVLSVLGIFVNEAVNGRCDGISVRICSDNSVEIKSQDRGFLIDDTQVDGHPKWYYNFCELYPFPKSNDMIFEVGAKTNTLYGDSDESELFSFDTGGNFDMCAAQYASEFMTVEAVRESVGKTLYFEKGYFVSNKMKFPSDENGTFIKFRPDSEIFGKYELEFSDIDAFLHTVALTVKGLHCELCDEASGKEAVYCFENGVRSRYEALLPQGAPIYEKVIEAVGRERYDRPEYSARVKVTVGFARDKGEMRCYHDFSLLPYGGRYFERIKEAILFNINTMYDLSLSFSDIERHLLLTVESNCQQCFSRYETARKEALDNRLVCEMAEDTLKDDFRYFLSQKKEYISGALK